METNFYKLSPEIKEFIIKEAKQHPKLGCRKLSGLIREAFNLDISKSSVSSILKSEGLNKSAGRPGAGRPQVTGRRLQAAPPLTGQAPPLAGQAGQEKLFLTADKSPFLLSHTPELFQEPTLTPEPEMAVPNTGCWFLKAADLCLGGAQAAGDLSGSVENLLYVPLSGRAEEQDSDFLLPRLFFEQLLTRQLEISKLKFILEDNSCFFLDGAGHTIWSTNRIPECFSAGLYKTKQELNSVILENTRPLILQAAPGFTAPTPAWLNFIASFQIEKTDKAIKRLELYSLDNLLIDTFQPVAQKRRDFIFALWPWQYPDRGILEKEGLRRIVYTPEGNGLPSDRQSHRKDGREILTIITNLEEAQHSSDEVIGHYLERWPNLEIGYRDFLDKIGHFSQLVRSKSSQKNNVQFSESKDLALSEVLSFWRRELNSYCQRHFFPSNCREQDFLLLKEHFYDLRARASSETNYFKLLFELPQGFLERKDLLYSCQQVNEADIHLGDGRKLRFEIE